MEAIFKRVGVGILLCTGMFFFSCQKGEMTFINLLEREKKLIQSFISKNGIEVLSEYPGNGVFGEKQYVLLDNGCYLHVVDSGNGNRAISEQTAVLLKCSAINLVTEEKLVLDADKHIKFTFGKAKDVMNAWRYEIKSPEYIFLSEGLEYALNFVGENAKIQMIIPYFRPNSDGNPQIYYPLQVCSEFQANNGIPFYYDEIIFQFENENEDDEENES